MMSAGNPATIGVGVVTMALPLQTQRRHILSRPTETYCLGSTVSLRLRWVGPTLDPEWEAPDDLLHERKFTVSAVLGEDIDEFVYDYDFGDGWEHRIVVEKRLVADPGRNTWPMCITGANACPPEDVGGPPGYMESLQAMSDPAHAEHSAIWRWHGGPFDPFGFSLNDANRAIKRVR